MKKIAIYLICLAGIPFLFTNCSNKELEKRIAKLEGRVAQLENGGTYRTPEAIESKSTSNIASVEEVPSGPLPEFEFEEEQHDFGTIKEGDIVEHTFSFKNIGEAPLIISKATASCGCTVPKWPQEPIPVGGAGEIIVKFNSRNKPGVQNKTVTITANTDPKIKRLRIKSTVTPKSDQPS